MYICHLFECHWKSDNTHWKNILGFVFFLFCCHPRTINTNSSKWTQHCLIVAASSTTIQPNNNIILIDIKGMTTCAVAILDCSPICLDGEWILLWQRQQLHTLRSSNEVLSPHETAASTVRLDMCAMCDAFDWQQCRRTSCVIRHAMIVTKKMFFSWVGHLSCKNVQ